MFVYKRTIFSVFVNKLDHSSLIVQWQTLITFTYSNFNIFFPIKQSLKNKFLFKFFFFPLSFVQCLLLCVNVTHLAVVWAEKSVQWMMAGSLEDVGQQMKPTYSHHALGPLVECYNWNTSTGLSESQELISIMLPFYHISYDNYESQQGMGWDGLFLVSCHTMVQFQFTDNLL